MTIETENANIEVGDGCIYIWLDGDRHDSVEQRLLNESPHVMLDLDKDGLPIGIEIIDLQP